MGELKPLGSEKLKGDEKLNRILELTYYQNPINENNTNNKKYDLIVEGKNSVYGIEKEKDGYYVKKGINESSLDYIGGLYMKNKNRFSTYNDALKKLEFLKGQEELNEATRYVLKNKSTSQIPNEQMPPAPAETELPPAPEGDVPASPEGELPPAPEGDMDMGDELSTGVEGEDEETGDPLKDIQKYTGKLTQKMREFEEIESDDIKYVLNMIISAYDPEQLDDEDKEEILDKLEGEEDFGDGEEMSSDEEIPEPETQETPEDELGETYASLEELTNTDFNFEDDDEMVDISNEFEDDEIDQNGNYYDNDDDFEIYEEDDFNYEQQPEDNSMSDEETEENLNIGDIVTVEGLTGEYQCAVNYREGKPFLVPFNMETKEADTSRKIYLTALNDPKLTKVMDFSETKGGFMNERDLSEYFDDEDYVDPSENPNFYDIEGDDLNIDEKLPVSFDDEVEPEDEEEFDFDFDTYHDDEEDETEDYGTTSQRNRRRPSYNDELTSLNEIKDIIKKYRIN